jgi:Ion channel
MVLRGRVRRRRPRSVYSPGSYGLAILLIVGTYALGTMASQRWTVSTLLFVQIGTVWYSLRASQAHAGVRLSAALIFTLALVAGGWNLFAYDGTLVALTFLAATALYVVAPLSIVLDVGRRRDVDREVMLGALATYLMIGMAFGFAYRCLAAVQHGAFFGAAGNGTLADSLFFSFVTLTTTGYGNLVPAGNPGQSLAVLEALLGQLFLVTAVAKIVTVWRPRAWRSRETEDREQEANRRAP